MRRDLSKVLVLVVAVALGAYLALPTLSADAAQGKDKNVKGRQLFAQYCASCHGADAKGGGPAAAALKTAPADLTRIAKQDGKFPALRVQRIISGDDAVAGHGSREMPIWGQYFRMRYPDKLITTGNLYALTMYVESIQQK